MGQDMTKCILWLRRPGTDQTAHMYSFVQVTFIELLALIWVQNGYISRVVLKSGSPFSGTEENVTTDIRN